MLSLRFTYCRNRQAQHLSVFRRFADRASENPDLAGASESCANNDEVPPHIVHVSFMYRYDLDVRNYMDTHRCDFGSPSEDSTESNKSESLSTVSVMQSLTNLQPSSEVRVFSSPWKTADHKKTTLLTAWLWSWSFHFGNSSNMRLAVGMWWNGAPGHGEATPRWQHKMLGTNNKSGKEREHGAQIGKKRIKEIANIIANIEILIYRNLIYLLKKDRPWRINPTPRHTTAAEELQTRPWNGRGPRPQSWNRSLRRRFRRFLGDRTTAAWTSYSNALHIYDKSQSIHSQVIRLILADQNAFPAPGFGHVSLVRAQLRWSSCGKTPRGIVSNVFPMCNERKA